MPATYRCCLVLAVAFAVMAAGAVPVAVPRQTPASVLYRAEDIKTSDNVEFERLLHSLDDEKARLTPAQAWHLRYLEAWQAAYRGNYPLASSLLGEVERQTADPVLSFRARTTQVNILGIGRRYQEAFLELDRLVAALPRITDPRARFQGMGEIAQFYIGAGQYENATRYIDKMVHESTARADLCKANFLRLRNAFQAGRPAIGDQDFIDGIAICMDGGDTVFANEIRADLASRQLRRGDLVAASAVLRQGYGSAVRDRYRSVSSRFDALLAQVALQDGSLDKALASAKKAVDASIKDEYTEPLVLAYEVLYQASRRRGDLKAALAYHEKYMAADKAYLDDVSAKALAYQMVKQQVQAKKAEVDALARKNRILELQQALDRKAVEASRLYIAVLLLGLLAIGLWLLRLKRSQLEFMRMAQCDSLTGIFNRKHFMSEAEHALRYAERSARGAALILIDLDHFKLTNDTYGHAMGDQVLRRAVMACQEFVRSPDVFGRLGGEEFGVLLPECGLESGIERAELIRRAIAALSDQEEPGIPVSASFGVACTGESGYDLRQLLMDSDHALYRAKRAGRNCVVAGKQGDGVVVA